ncbi:MAG TPA: GldM family protein [Saprospiraceae bacterium]|nr:GldM family protein [Saprospiraceae bacterium]
MQKPLLPLLGALIFTINLHAQKPDCPVTLVATASKMNVLYIGVDNPIQVGATGIPADSLEVTISEGTIIKTGKGVYVARISTPGMAIITVTGKDKKYKTNFEFRAKRMPDPTPSLGTRNTRSDTLGVAAFKALSGIYMVMENFDFDARCITLEYKVTHIGANESDGKMAVKSVKNLGGKFNPEAIEMVNQAKSGDIFVFSEITAKCPEDVKDRKLNGMMFFIGD